MQTVLHLGGQPVCSMETPSLDSTRQASVTVGLQLSESRAGPRRGVMAKRGLYRGPWEGDGGEGGQEPAPTQQQGA